MEVKCIVANIHLPDPAAAEAFYRAVLGLELIMDHGWIRTYGNDQRSTVQVSFTSQGGSDTALPALSVEVDNLD